jgi:hypothetical protein
MVMSNTFPGIGAIFDCGLQIATCVFAVVAAESGAVLVLKSVDIHYGTLNGSHSLYRVQTE